MLLFIFFNISYGGRVITIKKKLFSFNISLITKYLRNFDLKVCECRCKVFNAQCSNLTLNYNHWYKNNLNQYDKQRILYQIFRDFKGKAELEVKAYLKLIKRDNFKQIFYIVLDIYHISYEIWLFRNTCHVEKEGYI